MKKLIFRKFIKDISFFFVLMCITLGLIVWTLQAVNYLDFVTQDGHGLKTYFAYTIFNFPKIIHRIIPFIFFITLFYLLTNYEHKNELSIFWINGVSKIDFTNNTIYPDLVNYYAKKLNIQNLDSYSFFKNFDKKLWGDFDPHFNADGYKLYADYLFLNTKDFINNKLKK